MRYLGIIKKIDSLGRLVIPKEFRDSMKIQKGDLLEVFLTGSGVVIKKPNAACTLCGNNENLMDFEEGLICAKCIKKIRGM